MSLIVYLLFIVCGFVHIYFDSVSSLDKDGYKLLGIWVKIIYLTRIILDFYKSVKTSITFVEPFKGPG